jgi:hypothetical protein
VRQLKKIAPLLAAATAPLIINAGASRATLFIDLIEVSPTRTEFRTSGSLNIAGITPAQSSVTVNFGDNPNARSGLNTNSDVIRFSQLTVNTLGNTYSFTGPTTDPFTADSRTVAGCNATSGNCLAITSPTPSAPAPFFLNAGSAATVGVNGSTIWLPTGYVSGSSIANSFFLDRSLASIGLVSPTVTYTLTGGVQDTIVFRAIPVPGPLPILGAATAFSFSRRLRSRVRSASKAKQPQQA